MQINEQIFLAFRSFVHTVLSVARRALLTVFEYEKLVLLNKLSQFYVEPLKHHFI